MSAKPPLRCPASFRSIHTGLTGPDQPEATMWNADSELGTAGPDLPEAEVYPESAPLSPKARLESIASILALAVFRRRIRTTQPSRDREKGEEIRRKAGEGLDSWREQSVHA